MVNIPSLGNSFEKIEEMEADFIHSLYKEHQESQEIPSPSLVCNWLNELIALLFPEFSDHRYSSLREFEKSFQETKFKLFKILETMEGRLPLSAHEIEYKYMEQLPTIKKNLQEDANAILLGDPAAVSLTEVIRTYPGFYALAVYRMAHEFYQLRIPLIPRILTEYVHGKTGIDIHPGAKIGSRFCIDHGTGVVIGETVEIGNDVKIYQGVTLGALSVKKEMAQTKRHPTIEDKVVIYAGATILGGETIIGHDSIIGGNVWITKSVDPYSQVYYTGNIRQKQKEISN